MLPRTAFALAFPAGPGPGAGRAACPRAAGNGAYRPAIYLYVFERGLLVWRILRKEWKLLALLPEARPRQEPMTCAPLPLVLWPSRWRWRLCLSLSLADNLFTPFNVTLWVLAIMLLCLGVLAPGSRPPGRTRPSQLRTARVKRRRLANDRLSGRPLLVTSARQGNMRIAIGVPFATAHGGTLTLECRWRLQLYSAALEQRPAWGLQETFRLYHHE